MEVYRMRGCVRGGKEGVTPEHSEIYTGIPITLIWKALMCTGVRSAMTSS
jgi:hypothetical protein